MTTDTQYAAWLDDPDAIPVLLFEVTPSVSGTPTTLYFASQTYRTNAADTPANTNYPGIARIDTDFAESLTLDYQGSLSYGSVELQNHDGAYFAWLGSSYVWANATIKIWLGDIKWVRADFYQVFEGLVAGNLDSRSPEVLNIKLRNKMERLNTSVTETKLGGSTTNKDAIRPKLLGEVSNGRPLLTDPSALTYQFHDGVANYLGEVRDEGVPLANDTIGWAAVTRNLATGSFTLNQAPAGTITYSAQGDVDGSSVYASTVSAVIKRLVTGYGNSPFSAGEIDTASFTAFDSANASNTAAIGRPVTERENLGALCREIAATLGAQLVQSRLGQLRLLQINLPPTGTIQDIPEAWMVDHAIAIIDRPDVVAAIKLGFCKNWTVQDSLQTSLPPEHAKLFAEEWLTATSVDATVQAAYRLSADVEQTNTLLLRGTDAAAEAQRRRDLLKTQRTVFEFRGDAPCLRLVLGQGVRIFNSKFNLSGGVTGMVIGLKPNWASRRVTVQVLV